MSTEHVSEHDLEYGPTPPGAKYEHTDIDVAVGYKFALWLSVAMVISIAIVYGTFWFFEGRTRSANEQAQKYPLAASVPAKAPPTPNLQTQPFRDVYALREAENKKLTEYGWVDKDGGVTHIPIDRAMEVMLQRGFPTRADNGALVGGVMQDSSSGRTVVPR
ncbi:MAG TPA: hypothetical protein VFZ31_08790 [Vicinamibacterales bacterium]